MLDENLPTFFVKSTSDNPLNTTIYFTQNGDEPSPEYAYKRPDPGAPQSRNKFALGLTDAFSQGIIYGEVLIEPEWQQPTLSAAEIRAQNGVPPPAVPMIPDNFSIQLYNPDQQIQVKGEKSTWTGKESWEFEMPQQSFKLPSNSKLDQEHDPTENVLAPKIMFKWKRDSKFSKDMTCYMTGRSIGKTKSKEPDITIALFHQGRNPGLTIYEPNLNRVEIEDRKGLELALLLGAEVIRDIYLFPNRDSFNLNGTPPPNKRKNSRPVPSSASPKPPSPVSQPQPYAMSGGLGANAALPPSAATTAAFSTPPATSQPQQQYSNGQPVDPRRQAEVDAETKRLQALVEKEERERERRDKEEQRRIKKMLEQEEKEARRRDAEVAKETERLRREFGMEGQDYNRPNLPPRQQQPNSSNVGGGGGGGGGGLQPAGTWNGAVQVPPPRPVSAGPPSALGSWWHGPGIVGPPPPAQQQQHVRFGTPQPPGPGASGSGPGGRRRNGSTEGEGGRIRKKRSVFF